MSILLLNTTWPKQIHELEFSVELIKLMSNSVPSYYSVENVVSKLMVINKFVLVIKMVIKIQGRFVG